MQNQRMASKKPVAIAPADPLNQSKERRYLFVPCQSKKELKNWIRVYLGLDYPDGRVDPSSNSDPMSLLWELYSAAVDPDREWERLLGYASRFSFKTLSASILELLFLIHHGRNIAHMAALEAQAQNSQEYIKKFLKLPIFNGFLLKDNTRELFFSRYLDPVTNMSFTEKEVPLLPTEIRDRLQNLVNYIKIIVATTASANGLHTNLVVLDEVDLITNKEAYNEAKLIPTEEKGFRPITFLTSTRKYSIGLVQKEIDAAAETGLEVRHWNILDVTERCTEARHQPTKTKLPIYRSQKLLKAISEEDFERLDIASKEKYVKDEGYWGCLNECKLFAACKGNLVKQTNGSSILKSIGHIIQQFSINDPERANAQLLCNKPSKEGMIYPNLDAEIHFKSAQQIANMITGEEFPEKYTQKELIGLAQSLDCRFVSGMDHGYTHNFAVCTGFIYGNKLFMIDSFAVPELEISQKINLCNDRIKHLDPTIYPDPADPGSRKTFINHGYKCKEFKKGPGSVLEGINAVRTKLMPSLGREPEVYFIKDNDGVLNLFGDLSKYHWIVGVDEKPTDVPDDDNDDSADAFRYLIMNEFPLKKKNRNASEGSELPYLYQEKPISEPTVENFITNRLEALGVSRSNEDLDQNTNKNDSKSSIKWRF